MGKPVSPHPWIQTASGIAFNLLKPKPAMVDFEVDIPEALARICRFTGHVRSGPYSVAEHCVRGADALMRDTGDASVAASFLLHDAHEAYVGDIATPLGKALSRYTGIAGGLEALAANRPSIDVDAFVAACEQGQKLIKATLDSVIHERAGLAWPLPPATERLVKLYDLRMLATERRHLLGPAPEPWGPHLDGIEPIIIRGRFRVWPWPEAADAYRDRLRRYLPHLITARNPLGRAGARKKKRRLTPAA